MDDRLSERSPRANAPGSEVGSVRGIGDVSLRQMPGRDDLRLPGELVVIFRRRLHRMSEGGCTAPSCIGWRARSPRCPTPPPANGRVRCSARRKTTAEARCATPPPRPAGPSTATPQGLPRRCTSFDTPTPPPVSTAGSAWPPSANASDTPTCKPCSARGTIRPGRRHRTARLAPPTPIMTPYPGACL